MSYYLSSYTVDGTWLGFSELQGSLQLCDGSDSELTRWQKFGTNLETSCYFNVVSLVNKPTPLVYELCLYCHACVCTPLTFSALTRCDARQWFIVSCSCSDSIGRQSKHFTSSYFPACSQVLLVRQYIGCNKWRANLCAILGMGRGQVSTATDICV